MFARHLILFARDVCSTVARACCLTLCWLVAACGTESMRKAAPPVTPASTPEAAAERARDADSASRLRRRSDSIALRTPPASAADSGLRTSAPASASRTASVRDTMRLPLLAVRTKHDTISYVHTIRAGARREEWSKPIATLLAGSVLPAKRIVAFYGNPLSKAMGALGEFPVDEMLARLDAEVKRWEAADPSTPVQPALHLIAVVAQGSPGRDGKYRLRMPDSLIETVYSWARRRNALLFLDIQVGLSSVQAELPRLLPFLERPDVHLGLDPEFSMHYDKEGLKPGTKIGTMMAADVNYAVRTLADLVAAKGLPPKVLVVHRFTKRMVPNPREITVDPRVQLVMDMDGWGPPWLKFDSYRDYIVADPVQFTGFKIFFHNDSKAGNPILTPAELLRLVPKPLYIQYQ